MWSVFDDMEKRTGSATQNYESTMNLACDIDETDHAFLISFDAPGIKKDDINIEVTGRQLTVSGERKRDHQAQEGTARRWERSYGKFLRTFELPDGVNTEQVEASFEHGVLKIAIPKSEMSKTRKVAIGDSPKGFLHQLKQKVETKVANN